MDGQYCPIMQCIWDDITARMCKLRTTSVFIAHSVWCDFHIHPTKIDPGTFLRKSLCLFFNFWRSQTVYPPSYFPQILILAPCFAPFLSYQDLSNEQARYQEVLTEVQRLTQQLQNAEADLKMRNDALNQSREEIESLSKRLKTSESLLQLEKSRAEVDATFSSNSDSDTADVCQTLTGETSPDQSPAADGGRDCTVTRVGPSGGTERQLSERLKELEKEVRVWIYCGTVSLWVSFSGGLWCRWSISFRNSCWKDASGLSAQSRLSPPRARHFISRTTALSLLISFYNVTSATVNLPYLFCCSHAVALTLSLALKNTHTDTHIKSNIKLWKVGGWHSSTVKVGNFIWCISQ